jgi:transcriptional regulator with XRE-family HTH domain
MDMITTIAGARIALTQGTGGALRAALAASLIIPFSGIALPSTAMGLKVGTGGAPTVSYYRDRGSKGYPVSQYNLTPAENNVVVTPVDNLARIRAVLKPTMTELARVLNVSRQAIYDWQSGSSITAENASKLADLARAADVFVTEGLTTTHQVLRRQIAGKSFFDRVRDGETAEAAARSLLKIVRRELEQRQALAERLRDRARPTISTEDIGVPHLSERG